MGKRRSGDPFDFVPERWGQFEQALYADAVGMDLKKNDPVLEALYHEAYFAFENPRLSEEIRETLKIYVRQKYKVDWDDQFDWEAWRVRYESDAS